jgi:hypothetical protein
MLSYEDINALGNVIDTTFGRSSSYSGQSSVKCSLAGDVLTVNYVCVVTLVSEIPARDQVSTHKSAAQKIVNEYMKKIKSEFKDISGHALKTKEISSGDSIEILNASPYVLKRNAYYRFNATFSVS